MLDDFIVAHGAAIRASVGGRVEPRTSARPTEARQGVPAFLDQVGRAMRLARACHIVDHEQGGRGDGERDDDLPPMGSSIRQMQGGRGDGERDDDLPPMGSSIRQIVTDYGVIRQTVTELASEMGTPLSVEDLRTLDSHLDDAIGEAVTEHARQRNGAAEGLQAQRSAALAHLAMDRESLRTSRQELEELIRLSPVPTAIFRGPEHVYWLVNAAHDQMLGKRVEGKSIREAHTREEAGLAPEILDRVHRTGEPFIAKETPYVVKGDDGRLRHIWNHHWFYPVRDAAGAVTAILGVAQDVTEQIVARNQLSSVLEALPAFVSRVDADERFVFINQSNERYFGPREDILGKTMREHFGEAYDGFEEHVGAALRGEAVKFEWSSPPRGDRLAHHFIVSFAPERRPPGEPPGFISIMLNIDDLKIAALRLKTAYSEVQAQRARLEEERVLRERFVTALSHDLRNPLAAARMAAELLAEEGNDPSTIRKLAGKVGVSIDRADEMIRDLLDANRIQAGEPLRFEVEACELNEVAAAVIEELVAIHGDRFTLRGGLPIAGYWSRSGLRRILENLCSNAIKYGAAKRPVTVSLLQIDDTVKIGVHNEGPAIPSEELATMFTQYRRAASARTGGQQGWGLGLTLARGIASAQGGSVGVASSDERGTTFCLLLPLDAREATG